MCVQKEYIVVEEQVISVVEVTSTETVVVEDVVTETIEIGIAGEQGPKGDKGDPGENADQSFQYVHNQAVASAMWNIPHNLGGYPNITVEDSAGTVVEGA